jgi:MFS transporter, DHA3 family, macrolide efflux protein
MTSPVSDRGLRTFLVVWLGQVVSLLGSGLTGFALGVRVYQETGSVTRFALIAFFASLPGLLISPLAGALIDRWDRRLTLLFSDCLAAASTLGLLLLVWSGGVGRLEMWHVYGLMAVGSVANAFQWPAFTAATTLLVPKRHLGRAAGLSQMGVALAQIVSPFTGGLLVTAIGLRGVLAIDLATFGFAALTLLAVRFREPRRAPREEGERRSLWAETGFGWRYLRERPGLLSLLVVFAGTNFSLGMLQALLAPLILSFASAATLGSVLSTAGVGMLAGTVVMSVWGGPKRRIRGIFAGLLAQGVILLLGGFQPSVPLIASAAFVFLFALPILLGCSQAIWQSKVAPEVQGRVFAVRRMVAQSSLPVAYLVAGPLADRVFEPLLAPGGALAGTVGAVIGVGEGRGIGLLFMVLGALVIAGLAAAFANPRLRGVEDELPDAVGDEPGPEPAGLEAAL